MYRSHIALPKNTLYFAHWVLGLLSPGDLAKNNIKNKKRSRRHRSRVLIAIVLAGCPWWVPSVDICSSVIANCKRDNTDAPLVIGDGSLRDGSLGVWLSKLLDQQAEAQIPHISDRKCTDTYVSVSDGAALSAICILLSVKINVESFVFSFFFRLYCLNVDCQLIGIYRHPSFLPPSHPIPSQPPSIPKYLYLVSDWLAGCRSVTLAGVFDFRYT